MVLGFLGYVGFEFIIGMLDSRYSRELDAHLGINKYAISRLHDPAYFAEQSVFVSEDQKTGACISSPEHRILINDPAEIPPLFTNAILASEDKNFFTHEGIDKGAILRALAKMAMAWIDVTPSVDDCDHGFACVVRLRAAHRSRPGAMAERPKIVGTVPAVTPQGLGVS